jgi:hypothetical protein
MSADGNPPASKDAEPRRRVSHNAAVTVAREVGEVVIWRASSKADKIVSIATNDAKSARSCNMSEML